MKKEIVFNIQKTGSGYTALSEDRTIFTESPDRETIQTFAMDAVVVEIERATRPDFLRFKWYDGSETTLAIN